MAHMMVFAQYRIAGNPNEYRYDFGVVDDARMGLAVLTVLEECLRSQTVTSDVAVADVVFGIETSDTPAQASQMPGYDVIAKGVAWIGRHYGTLTKRESPG